MSEEYEVPEQLYYTKEHEWVSVSDNTATVGITDYAQKSLHEIVYVELPEVGRELTQGEVMGSVESVKAVSDVYAPVSGRVVEVNEKLLDEPETLNNDPYGEGWIAKIELTNFEEDKKKLMTAEQYRNLLKEL